MDKVQLRCFLYNDRNIFLPNIKCNWPHKYYYNDTNYCYYDYDMIKKMNVWSMNAKWNYWDTRAEAHTENHNIHLTNETEYNFEQYEYETKVFHVIYM